MFVCCFLCLKKKSNINSNEGIHSTANNTQHSNSEMTATSGEMSTIYQNSYWSLLNERRMGMVCMALN